MNKLIIRIEYWHTGLSPSWKNRIDLLQHYLLAYWILLIIASLTLYIGNICTEMFEYCALLALPMIPLRIVVRNYYGQRRHNEMLQNVLSEILNEDQTSQNDTDEEDDDDWFMRIAKGKQ